MLALYIIGGIAIYLMVVGALTPTLTEFFYSGPPNFRSLFDAKTVAILASLFWPISFPIGLGYFLSNKFDSDARENRLENKHYRELEKARHKVALANLAADEVAAKERAAGINMGGG